MNSEKKGILTTAFATFLAVVSFVLFFIGDTEEHPSRLDIDRLNCIIELDSYNDTSATLITGFNYYIVKEFAKERGIEATVRLSDTFQSGLDSLRRGGIDLLILPFEKERKYDSVLVSIPVDSQSVWLTRADWRREMKEINHWIRKFHRGEDFDKVRASYMKVYSPFRSRPRQVISPYDSLIINYADSIDWDWRMLAAVIFQESHFHIEARSPRGARGLMQMMPATAEHFGALDLLDPEQSIRAGSRFLQYLSARYNRLAANKEERIKYVLAAYNAGGGRIRDCILFARSQGIEPRKWEDIVGIIPLMRDSTNVAAVPELKLGVFHGHETINYVDRVFALYREFCRIAPERE